MSKVSESIWSNENVIIPMAEVSYIIKMPIGIEVIMKHSEWQNEYQHWSPMVVISNKEQATSFKNAWCYYRYELEGGKKRFKNPKDK